MLVAEGLLLATVSDVVLTEDLVDNLVEVAVEDCLVVVAGLVTRVVVLVLELLLIVILLLEEVALSVLDVNLELVLVVIVASIDVAVVFETDMVVVLVLLLVVVILTLVVVGTFEDEMDVEDEAFVVLLGLPRPVERDTAAEVVRVVEEVDCFVLVARLL